MKENNQFLQIHSNVNDVLCVCSDRFSCFRNNRHHKPTRVDDAPCMIVMSKQQTLESVWVIS